MGIINKILPRSLKSFSRHIGYNLKAQVYKIRSFNKTINSSPIFILGNQKSGTSVIASLLGKYIKRETSIDLAYANFNYKLYKYLKANKISIDDFVNHNKLEFSNEIIKEPHLSIFYPRLRIHFPKSKFVMIIRNPIHNIRSILDRLDIKGNKNKLDKVDKKKYFYSWKLLLNNSWINGEKQHYIETLAERWNIIANIYLNNKNDFTLIKYEDFLENKTKNISKLAYDLNFKEKNNISNIINKQYQPRGKERDKNPIDFFGKKNYNRILVICEINMKKLGYL